MPEYSEVQLVTDATLAARNRALRECRFWRSANEIVSDVYLILEAERCRLLANRLRLLKGCSNSTAFPECTSSQHRLAYRPCADSYWPQTGPGTAFGRRIGEAAFGMRLKALSSLSAPRPRSRPISMNRHDCPGSSRYDARFALIFLLIPNRTLPAVRARCGMRRDIRSRW